MSDRFPLLALDLAGNTGWAVAAHPDARPYHGTQKFGAEGEALGPYLMRLWRWLSEMRAIHRPGSIVYEAPITVAGANSHAKSLKLMNLAGTTELWCQFAALPCEGAHLASIRKSFCGNGRAKKPEVMEACRLRGWAPQNDNEGDALALLAHQAAILAPRGSLGMPPLLRRGAA